MQNLFHLIVLSASTLESTDQILSCLSFHLTQKEILSPDHDSQRLPGGCLPALLICFLFLKGTHSCAPAVRVCTSQNALCLDTHLLAPSLQVSP